MFTGIILHSGVVEAFEKLPAGARLRLRSGAELHHIRLPASEGSRIAWLHARGEVVEQRADGNEMAVTVRLSPENWARFQSLDAG